MPDAASETTQSSIPFIVLGGYLVFLLVLGVVGYLKSQKGDEDYYLAGRRQGWLVSALTIMATFFSSWALLGAPGKVYTEGLVFALFALNVPLSGSCIVLFGRGISARGRARGFVTPGDMVADHYGGETIRILTALTSILYVVPYVVMQIQAGGLLFDALVDGRMLESVDNFTLGAIVLATITTVYIMVGGMRSVAWTDVFQGILLVVGMLLGGYVVVRLLGGLEGFSRQVTELPEVFRTAPGVSGTWAPLFLFSVCSVGAAGTMVSPAQWMRYYAADSTRTLKRSAIIFSIVLTACFLFGVMLVGIGGQILYPCTIGDDGSLTLNAAVNGKPDEILVVVLKEQLPKALPVGGHLACVDHGDGDRCGQHVDSGQQPARDERGAHARRVPPLRPHGRGPARASVVRPRRHLPRHCPRARFGDRSPRRDRRHPGALDADDRRHRNPRDLVLCPAHPRDRRHALDPPRLAYRCVARHRDRARVHVHRLAIRSTVRGSLDRRHRDQDDARRVGPSRERGRLHAGEWVHSASLEAEHEVALMPEWDPTQYHKFSSERFQPAVDLLARVKLEDPRVIYDLGCGTGEVTGLLAQRWSSARVTGVDNSTDMLHAAASTTDSILWVENDIETWAPDEPPDLIYSNAVLHWVGRHDELFPRLLKCLAAGGCLAVQMPLSWGSPSHRLMREVLDNGGPNGQPIGSDELRQRMAQRPVESAASYYELLADSATNLELWETEYIHALSGDDAVLEWVRGTGLRPILEGLSDADRDVFLADYSRRLRDAYPRRSDGRTLYPFRRLFLVAHV